MGTTPILGLRYPNLTEQPHGPLQMKALAEDVEAKLAPVTDTGSSAWLSYTPTFTGSTTNPVTGTGGLKIGKYTRIGRTVFGRFRVQFGSSGINVGSGHYYLGLPIAAAATAEEASANYVMPIGSWQAWKATGNNQVGTLLTASVTTARLHLAEGYVVTHNTPETWGAGSSFLGSFTYEAA